MSKEKEARFEKAAFGYRPEDVDRYIDEADKKLAAAKAEKAELLSKMKILADKITEYRSDEGNLKEAMLGAQRMKASIENEAKSKADTTVSEAQEYANQLIADAQAKSSQMVADAQERANKMVAEAQKTAEQKVNAVTKKQRRALVRVLKHFELEITQPRPVEDAIVTSGGISVREVAPGTMQSKRVPGLYFAGEILDVDAYTGGFNLQIAWSTGYLAGLHAGRAQSEGE